MKATIFCLLSIVAVVLAFPGGDTYTDKYDNINLDEILSNDRLLEGYIKCIMDEGRCTPEGKELKSNLKEALDQDCAKCTDVQRKGARQVFHHLIKHEQVYWGKLKAKYDPQNTYAKKYEDELKTLSS